jgi:hypothetical protein
MDVENFGTVKTDSVGGFVYVFESKSFSDGNWVKIGCTTDIGRRLENANNDSFVPLGVECSYGLKAVYYRDVEKMLHFVFRGQNKAKEFYEVSLGDIDKFCRYLEKVHLVEILDSEQIAKISEPVFRNLDQLGKYRGRQRAEDTTFHMLGIPRGSRLVYKDDETKFCVTVDDNNQVEFGGALSSLSALVSGWKGYRVNGYLYFQYSDSEFKDELLRDRRIRLAAKSQVEADSDDDSEEDS